MTQEDLYVLCIEWMRGREDAGEGAGEGFEAVVAAAGGGRVECRADLLQHGIGGCL